MKYTTPVVKIGQPNDTDKFKPVTLPKIGYPYHLSLNEIQPVSNPGSIEFHMVGDTGGSGNPEARQNIINQIAVQYTPGGFLYHLGDLVYHYGEAVEYENQFFKPFESYPGPIFAIAGNHDSDVKPGSDVPYETLDAFRRVFCDTARGHVPFSGESKRSSMTQPHVYWALETPLATFIGLHTNVPKYGVIPPEQERWLHEELIAASKDKMLVICLHHAPYSADTNHGSSLDMIKILENAFDVTGIRPDIVFSGHVHNYQRFHKTYPDGKVVPYIVCGAGGFDELHSIAELDDARFKELPLQGTHLEHYCDNQHGFLQISISKIANRTQLIGRYYTVMAGLPAVQRDLFMIQKA